MSRDAKNWAKQGKDLQVGQVPTGAINLNVQGRSVHSPIQGFGKMWQKTYKVNLGDDIAPVEVIKVWKERFPEFWPKGNAFYGPIAGIRPGDVALLNLSMPGGMKLSTGVLVLYADDESFTLMTPQGHPESGWVTFSAYEQDGAHFLFAIPEIIFELSITIYTIVKGFRPSPILDDIRYAGAGEGFGRAALAPQ